MLNSGQVLSGRYEIIKLIGKGGMSTVYQAKDLTTGNILAIKDVERTGKNGNEAVEQSLVTEGKMLMQLSNSHLPKIYDIIENPDSFLLVMDYIQGESLDKVIAREGAQPMDRVLDWGMQICEVFDYLHNQSTPIIYRDMKPANVILQPDGHLMMIDFGTARTQKVGVAMSADTLCLGTAGFAAPEQFGGIGQSTARTDVFCLGATLYNMITGHSPCDRPQGILPLERWNPDLKDTPISYIIYKCTRNDPDNRYQTARQLYEDLHKAKTGAFGDPSTWGTSGKLTGNIGQNFQKQNVKTTGGLGGGLSGLLQFGKSGAQEKEKASVNAPVVQSGGWQTGVSVPAEHYQGDGVNYYDHNPVITAIPQQVEEGPWRKLTLIGLAVAVVMVLLGVVLIVLKQLLAGLVFMIIAIGAAALAVVGVVFSRRTEG